MVPVLGAIPYWEMYEDLKGGCRLTTSHAAAAEQQRQQQQQQRQRQQQQLHGASHAVIPAWSSLKTLAFAPSAGSDAKLLINRPPALIHMALLPSPFSFMLSPSAPSLSSPDGHWWPAIHVITCHLVVPLLSVWLHASLTLVSSIQVARITTPASRPTVPSTRAA